MEYKRFGNHIILRVNKGEEIVESIKRICASEKISLGQINGIGATNKVKIGLFDVNEKKYYSNEYNEDFEITNLSGNISTMNGEIYLHMHITIADKKNNAFGGHLNSAFVSATFEGIITIIDGKIDRKLSEDVGLNIIKF